MPENFANLPKSVQEEILIYLSSGDFKAAVLCRDRHLKKTAVSSSSRISYASLGGKVNESHNHLGTERDSYFS